MPFPIRKMLVNALAYGVLRYGVTTFGHCTTQWRAKIDAILKGILRSVAYNTQFAADEDLFRALELPTFSSLLTRTVVLKYYWSDAYKTPWSNVRSLRTIQRFAVPRVHTNHGKKLRSFYVPDTFNKLPDNIFGLDSRGKLKRSLNELS